MILVIVHVELYLEDFVLNPTDHEQRLIQQKIRQVFKDFPEGFYRFQVAYCALIDEVSERATGRCWSRLSWARW